MALRDDKIGHVGSDATTRKRPVYGSRSLMISISVIDKGKERRAVGEDARR
jgi:hypothetical protein